MQLDSCHICRALLTSELGEIFQNAHTAPNAMADPRGRDAFTRATGKMPDTQDLSSQSTKKRIPGEDDDCPICYEGLFGVSEGDLTWCETCGNSIHNPCFQQCKLSLLLSFVPDLLKYTVIYRGPDER